MAHSGSNIEVINAFHVAMEAYFRTGDDSVLVANFAPNCVVSVPGMPDSVEGCGRSYLPSVLALPMSQSTSARLSPAGR